MQHGVHTGFGLLARRPDEAPQADPEHGCAPLRGEALGELGHLRDQLLPPVHAEGDALESDSGLDMGATAYALTQHWCMR